VRDGTHIETVMSTRVHYALRRLRHRLTSPAESPWSMLNCHPEARRTLSLFSTRPRTKLCGGPRRHRRQPRHGLRRCTKRQ